MSSNLVRCPECIAQVKVRKDNLESHIRRVHRKALYQPYRRTRNDWEWDQYYYNREGGYYLNRYTPQYHCERDRGYYSERYFSDNQSVDSQDYWSDTHEYSRANVYVLERDGWSPPISNSRRSSEVSDVSDTASCNTTNTDPPDSGPHSSNKQLDSRVVFYTPFSVVSQKRSTAGYSCPISKCTIIFVNIESLITHVKSKHQLERCPYCADVNFEFSEKLNDHIQTIHPKADRMSTTIPDEKHPSSSNEGSSLYRTAVSGTKTVRTFTNKVSKAHPNTETKLKKSITNTHNKTPKEANKLIRNSKVGKTTVKIPSPNHNEQAPFQANSQLSAVPVTAKIKRIPSEIGEEIIQENRATHIALPHTTKETDLNSLDHSEEKHSLIDEVIDTVYLHSLSRIHNDDDTSVLVSIRDIELNNDSNFRFVNTGDLVGYSLNI